mmetsp:Transcript_60845/g.131805  ORF Transcript_60845/g.131805 Transcript_60845/m.131805 type:complete len:232 (+) Transcript_60845:2-697(+)
MYMRRCALSRHHSVEGSSAAAEAAEQACTSGRKASGSPGDGSSGAASAVRAGLCAFDGSLHQAQRSLSMDMKVQKTALMYEARMLKSRRAVLFSRHEYSRTGAAMLRSMTRPFGLDLSAKYCEFRYAIISCRRCRAGRCFASGVVTRKLKTWCTGEETRHVSTAAVASHAMGLTWGLSMPSGTRCAKRGERERTLARLTALRSHRGPAPTPQNSAGLFTGMVLLLPSRTEA